MKSNWSNGSYCMAQLLQTTVRYLWYVELSWKVKTVDTLMVCEKLWGVTVLCRSQHWWVIFSFSHPPWPTWWTTWTARGELGVGSFTRVRAPCFAPAAQQVALTWDGFSVRGVERPYPISGQPPSSPRDRVMGGSVNEEALLCWGCPWLADVPFDLRPGNTKSEWPSVSFNRTGTENGVEVDPESGCQNWFLCGSFSLAIPNRSWAQLRI